MLNESKFAGTFDYMVDKLSEMDFKNGKSSKLCTIGPLHWKILVQKRVNDSNLPFLGVFIRCYSDQDDSSWRCYANVNFSLLSQKMGTDHYNYCTLKHLVHSKNAYWGTDNFMQWDNILRQSNGYLKNDEIVIRADVEYSFPVGLSLCQNRSLDSNPINSSTTGIAEMKVKLCENREKIESLEAEISQLKINSKNEKSNAKKISENLDAKSAEFESFRNTIASLELKTEKLKSDNQLKDFRESQLKIDLMNEKSNVEKISEELKTKSTEFEFSLGAMEEKIASLEELLKMEKLETAKKLKDLGDQLQKEKLIVEAYKDMFQKILS